MPVSVRSALRSLLKASMLLPAALIPTIGKAVLSGERGGASECKELGSVGSPGEGLVCPFDADLVRRGVFRPISALSPLSRARGGRGRRAAVPQEVPALRGRRRSPTGGRGARCGLRRRSPRSYSLSSARRP